MGEMVIFKLGSVTGSALPAAQTDLWCLTSSPALQVKGPPLAWPWVGGSATEALVWPIRPPTLSPEEMLLVST